jgi:glutamine amidotransferase-like uncharacterized protein
MLSCLTFRFRRPMLVLFFAALIFNTGQALSADDKHWVHGGVISRGLPFETPFHIYDTNIEGPTVLIIGGMHGNEPAGAEAAEHIRHWPITRGRLVIVPRANPPALAANTRNIPGKPSGEGNLNRNFPTTNPARSVVGPTARSLWEFLTVLKPDWVLDLHEGFDFHVSNSNSVGSSIIHVNDEHTTPFATRMIAVVNADIDDEDKKFVRIDRRGPINSGLVRATMIKLGSRGMVLETTWKEQPLSLRARQHRQMVHTFLSDLCMVDTPWRMMLPLRDEARTADEEFALRVAIYDDAGSGESGRGVNELTRVVGRIPDAALRYVCAGDIRDGALEQFDVVIFPGGRGSVQGLHLDEAGREQLLTFIRNGGGYMGICAGAYMATCRNETYLKAVRTYHHQPWTTGRGQVVIELTETGQEIFGADDSPITVRYGNGPLFFHEDGDVPDVDLPDFEVLAHFTRGVEKDGERQAFMEGTPAILSAPFGDGRFLLISPHPESDPALDGLLARGLLWAAGKCDDIELELRADEPEPQPATAQ